MTAFRNHVDQILLRLEGQSVRHHVDQVIATIDGGKLVNLQGQVLATATAAGFKSSGGAEFTVEGDALIGLDGSRLGTVVGGSQLDRARTEVTCVAMPAGDELHLWRYLVDEPL